MILKTDYFQLGFIHKSDLSISMQDNNVEMIRITRFLSFHIFDPIKGTVVNQVSPMPIFKWRVTSN